MKIVKPRVFHDYTILETLEAGLRLTGPEVKSVRGGRMSLDGAYIKIIGSEIYLLNAQIFPYPFARPEGYESKRTRKLLLHKREIISLKTKISASALTLVPLECYITHGFIKLKIGLAKGKREYEKREKIKKKDMERDVQRELRGKKD
ncbi:SsrA-binding protein SmpB [Candidatus Gottesmanbacteria bacterium]|nr:SsrA-binding protein SmpB [Candidatus Gottesmanbacteria bacterium]